MIINILAFALICISVFIILKLNFKEIFSSSYTALTGKGNLRSRTNIKEKSFVKKIRDKFGFYEYILSLYGLSGLYKALIVLSFVFGIAGIIAAIICNNLFLMIGLSIIFAYIPIFILDRISRKKEEKLFSDLEAFLYLVYSSYTRTYDIITSFEVNLPHLKNPALKNVFSEFVFECKGVSADIKKSVYNLRLKIKFDSFSRFCDFILDTLNDKSEISRLSLVLRDMSYIRKNNEKMKMSIKGMKTEFYMMSSLLVLNYPIIYMLNKDWFSVLWNTLTGKIFTSVIAVYIAFSIIYLDMKVKNIGYRREDNA